MGTLYRNGIPYVGSGGAGGVEVTQAEYDALPTSEKMNGSIYFITDGSVSYPTASQMRYDNTESGIPSTSVQGAIDELKIEIGDTDISSIGDGTLSGAISELNNGLTMKTTSQPTTVGTTIVFRKIGRLVIASHAGNFSVGATGTRYTIAEIPAEFTPIGDEYFSCVLTNSQNVVGNARLFFERNTQRVHLLSSLTGIQEYRFTVAYFSAS